MVHARSATTKNTRVCVSVLCVCVVCVCVCVCVCVRERERERLVPVDGKTICDETFFSKKWYCKAVNAGLSYDR